MQTIRVPDADMAADTLTVAPSLFDSRPVESEFVRVDAGGHMGSGLVVDPAAVTVRVVWWQQA